MLKIEADLRARLVPGIIKGLLLPVGFVPRASDFSGAETERQSSILTLRYPEVCVFGVSVHVREWVFM